MLMDQPEGYYENRTVVLTIINIQLCTPCQLTIIVLLCKSDSFPRLLTKDGKVKFHPKSVNSDESFFTNKFLIYHQKVKSSAVFIHDSSMIPPLPLLFFGGDISVRKDGTQETIAVDDWIVFQAPENIAKLVKVR